MTEADLDEVVAIDLDAFHPSDLGGTRAVRERSLREELSRPFSRLVVARGDGEKILGYALSWHVVDEAHLLNVAVAAQARRQGVGRALIWDLLAYAREHAVVRVLLEVRTSNAAAIALYASFGFSSFNLRARYYADGEDAVEMMLTLG